MRACNKRTPTTDLLVRVEPRAPKRTDAAATPRWTDTFSRQTVSERHADDTFKTHGLARGRVKSYDVYSS